MNNNTTNNKTTAPAENLHREELHELLHDLESINTQCRLLADTFAVIGMCYEQKLEPTGHPMEAPAEALREKTQRAQELIEQLWGYSRRLTV